MGIGLENSLNDDLGMCDGFTMVGFFVRRGWRGCVVVVVFGRG